MNSSSSSSLKKKLPLQLNKISQGSTLSTRFYRDKNSLRPSKQSESQSFSSKQKSLRHKSSKENILESRTTSTSVISKIPDEKEDPFFLPSHRLKHNKREQHTEKSFQDLNKSLANLALGRCIGRSSSDNDTLGHLNRTESDFQRSYGPSNLYMDANQTYHSTSKTPLSSKRSMRNLQTSVQRGMEVIPFSFVNQINRESVKTQDLQTRRDTSSRDLRLSDNSAYGKNVRSNAHYLPIDTKVRIEGRNFAIEASYRMESSNIDHSDNMDTQMLSKENDYEAQMESVRQIKVKQDQSLPQKKVPVFGGQNYRSTPSFEEGMRHYNANNISKMNNGNFRRYSYLASVPRTTAKTTERSTRIGRERSDKLDLNHISDDVEYTSGGVGIIYGVKKQKPNSRNKSSFVETEASSKGEGVEKIRRETLDIWKQDLMKIKKEMEKRKKSYAEVNKFMKLYEKGATIPRSRLGVKINLNLVAKESRESSFDPYATRKTSNISLENLSRLEMDTTKNRGLVSQESAKDRRMQCDLKTLEDYKIGKRLRGSALEEQSGEMSKLRVKTAPYYGFNETNDFNYSFMYGENFILEAAQRQPCCGPEKMCNIF